MSPEEQEALQYRFGGYQLELMQLDATGPAFIVLNQVHPYYRNQPTYWQKNAFKGKTLGTTEIVGGNIPIEQSGNDYPTTKGNGLIDLMSF